MMENGATLHHVGFVVASIQSAAAGFVRSLAMQWDGRIFHDPLQTVYVSFFQPALAGGSLPGNVSCALLSGGKTIGAFPINLIEIR